MSCRLLLTMFFIGLLCPNIHAGDPIWRIRPMGISFPLPDQANTGPGPGGLVRRYSLAQVFVDGTAGSPGLVDTITVFFVDDAPIPFGTMQGTAILNVFTVDGPAGLPLPSDNPDAGLLVEATFTQNKVDGWIEVQATNLSALPIPFEVKKGVRYYIGLTPVFVAGNHPFGGFHIANDLGKSKESQSAFRETSPTPGNWIFAGDLFGPPPELFATIEIERAASPCSVTLSENVVTTITPGNSVSCNAGNNVVTSNSYYRAFSMASITGDYTVTAIRVGVELAAENFDGTGTVDGEIPCTINFYYDVAVNSIAMDPNNMGSPTPDASVDAFFAGDGSQDLTVVELPVTGVTVPDSVATLIVEIFVPGSDSVTPNGDAFFIGSNAAGQSSPSFLAAAACGITTPTDTAALGFPNMHVVLIVDGCAATGCLVGDINLDGAVNLLDVGPFVALLTGGGFQCEADINEDGVVSLLDVSPFVAILSGG